MGVYINPIGAGQFTIRLAERLAEAFAQRGVSKPHPTITVLGRSSYRAVVVRDSGSRVEALGTSPERAVDAVIRLVLS